MAAAPSAPRAFGLLLDGLPEAQNGFVEPRCLRNIHGMHAVIREGEFGFPQALG